MLSSMMIFLYKEKNFSIPSSWFTNPSDQGLTEQRRDTKCEALKSLRIPRKFPSLSTDY